MREEKVYFESDGLKLAGVLHILNKRAPGVILCHGAGGHKWYHKWEADPLAENGFVVLRFDFRGCGESEGERGLIRSADEIADLKNAVTYLQSRKEVDGEKIGVCGHSLGGAIVIATSSEDRRIKAAISVSGPSNLWRIKDNLSPVDLEKFINIISVDKVKRAYEKPTKLSLADIPIKPKKVSVKDLEAAAALMSDPLIIKEFLVESLEDLMTFRSIDVVDRISPTPILFIHGDEDGTVDVEQAYELYSKAKEPKDLKIIEGAGHAIPVEKANPLIIDWFKRHLL